jgi:tryptophan-rich sensory protein
MRTWLSLSGFLSAAFAACAIGGFFTATSGGTWYRTLQKPGWNPPGWVFGPVWTVLYVLMAVAVWRVWPLRQQSGVATVIVGFFVQLVLNAGWSACFFGLRKPGAALGEIVLLWLLLAWLLWRFWVLDRWAGVLWALYVLWVSFATGLNFAIWRLNAIGRQSGRPVGVQAAGGTTERSTAKK